MIAGFSDLENIQPWATFSKNRGQRSLPVSTWFVGSKYRLQSSLAHFRKHLHRRSLHRNRQLGGGDDFRNFTLKFKVLSGGESLGNR